MIDETFIRSLLQRLDRDLPEPRSLWRELCVGRDFVHARYFLRFHPNDSSLLYIRRRRHSSGFVVVMSGHDTIWGLADREGSLHYSVGCAPLPAVLERPGDVSLTSRQLSRFLTLNNYAK